jgi:GTPase Era involved in 16S rRNA processing
MAMKTVTFEIKVALLGYVSAGKSTVLNALLSGKFSEVAMRRTTAGVNFFRVFSKEAKDNQVNNDDVSVLTQVTLGKQAEERAPDSDWRLEPDSLQSAGQTHETIKENNAKLRESNQVHESTFDVELDAPLCDMRKDTKLVLVDIPGLNEAGSKHLYRDYVNANWSTFDCVIAVMDVNQGVNTDEQVELIKLIHKNTKEKKAVPVIVLCNKVDDLEDDEVLVLVDEVRAKVEEVFQTTTASTAVDGAQGKDFLLEQNP